MLTAVLITLILVICSVSDVKSREIGILMPPAVAVIALIHSAQLGRLKESLITSFAVFSLLMLISLISKQALGLGDVAILSACSVYVKSASVILMISSAMVIASVVTIGIIAVGKLLKKRSAKQISIPLVPYITAGFLLTLV